MSKWEPFDWGILFFYALAACIVVGAIWSCVAGERAADRVKAERLARLYTVTSRSAAGEPERTWRDVHYVGEWRDAVTVETQDGRRITISSPYTIEQQPADVEVRP